MNNTKSGSRSQQQLIRNLNKQIKKNPLPAAIILVESEFRPLPIRLFEYLFFLYCSIMGRGRILKLSLGLSQVQFRYWLEYYGYNKSFLQFVRLFENQKSNYYIVEWYINQNNFRDLLDLSKIYTGKKNMYYVKKLVEALEIIKITRSDNMSFLQGLSNKNIIDNWDTLISHSLKKADNIIIEKIEKGQDQLIKSRKELGATSWFVIECFELPENYFAVMLEEGHVINYVLLKYDQTNDEFFSIYESNINENDG